ncbi:alpha/beta fold hydrolase [Actinomadura sp. 9N407]|uniref:alpha/beta fold hydrolase n=1 Tax=Actinomadura sp. 9N407 TaxID=3375154 RepID=UPI0037B87A53
MGPARRLLALLCAMVLLLTASPAVTANAEPARARQAIRPIIFVHGFFGSGSQFQTQAKRFAGNGYPATHIEGHDYDSLFANNTMEQVHAALDQRIARLKAATGADKVELVGHSLGTRVSQEYLNGSAARAANVAHYVNVDGGGAEALPGGVPTLAIWGEGNDGSITGATNVRHPNESHVETATSAASFAEMYRFFNGTAPATTQVVPQAGTIQIAGRAVLFPYNVGYTGGNARLEVYELDPATGRPTGTGPVANVALTGDGSFGPFTGSPTAFYEFRIIRTDTERRHHHYVPPLRRTDLSLRLMGSDPGSLVDGLVERNAAHSALLAYRNKEWWGDQGANGDTLSLNGTNVLTATTAARSKRAIGLFAYDWRSDRRTNVNQSIGLFPILPFMTGADIYLPASAQANGTVTIETRQRGGSRTARLAIPNWPSNVHTSTVYLDDYTQ